LTEICYLHPGKITDLHLAYRRIAGNSLYSTASTSASCCLGSFSTAVANSLV
jgi:hypothetical protein